MDKEIIGTDVSLDTCREEGYLMLESNKDEPFSPDGYYRVFAYAPEWLPGVGGTIIIDELVSFNDLLDTYRKNRSVMDECFNTGTDLDLNNPNYYMMLCLASDIQNYCGL